MHRDQTEGRLTDGYPSISTQARSHSSAREIALGRELPNRFCSALWNQSREFRRQVFLAHVKAALLKIPREEISKEIFFQQFYEDDVYVPLSAGTDILLEAEKDYTGFVLTARFVYLTQCRHSKGRDRQTTNSAIKTKTSISVVKSFFIVTNIHMNKIPSTCNVSG